MAANYESVATATSTAGDITIPKPSGLAEGNYMIAHIAGSNANITDLEPYTSSGWTQIVDVECDASTGTHSATALYKIADSSDVAASDFSFTSGAGAQTVAGAIYRISGGGVVAGTGDDIANSGSPYTLTNTITPTAANSLLLFLASGSNTGGTSFSGYAIANNDVSWTERVDFANTAGANDSDTTLAGATASRPEITATGNSTVSTAANINCVIGIMVSITGLEGGNAFFMGANF